MAIRRKPEYILTERINYQIETLHPDRVRTEILRGTSLVLCWSVCQKRWLITGKVTVADGKIVTVPCYKILVHCRPIDLEPVLAKLHPLPFESGIYYDDPGKVLHV